jgi:membrane protease YdiL (CAAX protease family)
MIAVRLASASLYAIVASLNLIDKEVFGTEISLSSRYGLTVALILMIVIIPIVEEFTFRGWLTKKKGLILLSIPFIIFSASQLFINLVISDIGNSKYFVISALVVGAVLISFKKIDLLESFIEKNFILLSYISILLFSLIHILNYQIKTINLTVTVSLFLILIPYPFSGYILTKLRLKNGLLWSILLHMMTNSLILIQVSTGNYRP